MNQKLTLFCIGMIAGAALATGFTILYFHKENEAYLHKVEAYIAYQTALEQGDIRYLEENKIDQELAFSKNDLLENWVRMVVARQIQANNKRDDNIYYTAKVYLREHPESWSNIPDRELDMLPDDPILPPKLNVRALIQSEMNRPDTNDPTSQP